MLDKVNGGLVAAFSQFAVGNRHGCEHQKEAANATGESKLDKLFDLLQELTKELKGNSGENGVNGKGKSESAFKDCVIPSTTGDGGAYLNPSKKEELAKIAEFMDETNANFPGTFKSPDNAGGSEGKSWKNELGAKADNYLNASELKEFEKAAKMMESALSSGTGGVNKASGPSAGEGVGQGGGIQQLLEKLIGMLERAMGKDAGKGAGGPEGAKGSEGPEGGDGARGKSGGLSGIMEMMEKMLQEMKQQNTIDSLIDKIMNAIKGGGGEGVEGAEGTNGAGGPGGTQGAGGAEGAGGLGGAEPGNQLTQVLKLLLELVKLLQGGEGANSAGGADRAGGKGGAEGAGLNDPALSPQKMDNALVQTGHGDAYANPSEQQTLDRVGAFMDKNTGVFGKPENGGSWAEALKGGNNISEQDNGNVQDAMKMLKMLMELLQAMEGGKGGSEFDQPQTRQGADAPRGSGGTPAATEAKSTGGTGNVSADAGNPPAGMPKELWGNCVEAGEKTGVDPFILAAQMKKESQFGEALNGGSPSAGDGLMQVEPGTRQAYAAKFEEAMGKPYDHSNKQDQVDMAAVILADKGGDATNMLQKYNGGDNWTPGTTDSYGREIKADQYAASVQQIADEMRASAGQ